MQELNARIAELEKQIGLLEAAGVAHLEPEEGRLVCARIMNLCGRFTKLTYDMLYLVEALHPDQKQAEAQKSLNTAGEGI